MKRDWSAMRAKVVDEGVCRVGGSLHGRGIDAAHVIPRSRIPGEEAMRAANCIPLCRECHTSYDGGHLDILPYLTRVEQTSATDLVGIAEAYQRLIGGRV